MLFLTNRSFVQGAGGKPGRRVDFDLDDNGAGDVMSCCERSAAGEYVELGREAFLERGERECGREILVYIHGYANLPEAHVFPRAESLQRLFDAREAGWVTVIPALWPCDNDPGMIKDYWDDQKAADGSAAAFGGMLRDFEGLLGGREPVDDAGGPAMSLLAHSMGNRVLRGAMRVWKEKRGGGDLPCLFGNVFMAAADLVNEALEVGRDGALICDSARHVVVYHALGDSALQSSKLANLKKWSRRLGQTGPEDMDRVAGNVYAIDCKIYSALYDPTLGHAYFLEDPDGEEGAVFKHIRRTLRRGEVPMPLDAPGQRRMVL